MLPTKSPDLAPVFGTLPADDVVALQAIAPQLSDAWAKRQVFRTETEARVSVLNDGKHPTPASKYWQSVREQTVFLDNLTSLSFEMRRLDLSIKRITAKLAAATTDDEREDEQINLDEALWKKAQAEQVAHDRVREILQWEMLKAEQVAADPTFDTTDPNTHQAISLYMTLQNRRQCLTEHADPAERMNVLGPLASAEKYVHKLGLLEEKDA